MLTRPWNAKGDGSSYLAFLDLLVLAFFGSWNQKCALVLLKDRFFPLSLHLLSKH